jgi:Leucine-rich repeat (LRR) protein
MLFCILDSNELTGQIPSELALLPNLEYLHLGMFFLSFSFDILYYECTLICLDAVLILEYNALTGPIPSELALLPNLEYLDLGMFFLSFSFDILYYECTLICLDAVLISDNNDLTGQIPSELALLPNLEYLDLGKFFLSFSFDIIRIYTNLPG